MWCIPFSQTRLEKPNRGTTQFQKIESLLYIHYIQGDRNTTTYFQKAKIWQYIHYIWCGMKCHYEERGEI